jgi:MFS family permease
LCIGFLKSFKAEPPLPDSQKLIAARGILAVHFACKTRKGVFMEFLKTNARWLGAGALMTFSTGFGQTYFISIFAGELRSEFDLSHGQWGGIYTAGTAMSAALMLMVGQMVDKMTIRRAATVILVMFSIVCAAMSLNTHAPLLILLIFGLRFCGQGMLGHIAMVAAGRWYAENRGKAVSFISLGFSIGEAVLPILFVLLMSYISWRSTWVIAAIAALFFILPLRYLLQKERQARSASEDTDVPGLFGRHWTRGEALTHWFFWMILPAFIAMPIFSTALFFQQVHLTQIKAWTLSDFVALIPIMTLTTIATTLATGRLIDRVGSGFLLPLFLLPLAVAFVVLSFTQTIAGASVAFILIGLSHGCFSTLGGTFWPEYFGTKHLGSVRSVATSVMVFGSAIGPGATGVLIDLGVDFDTQLIGISAILVAASILATVALARIKSSSARV